MTTRLCESEPSDGVDRYCSRLVWRPPWDRAARMAGGRAKVDEDRLAIRLNG